MKKKISNTYPKPPSICNCVNIRRAARAVTQFYEEELKPSGLTISQFGLLRHVENAQVVTISKLAALMRIDRTTLNRNLKPLLDNGLVVIIQGKDSRTRQVSLTESGKKCLESGCLLWESAQSMLENYLGNEDHLKLTQLLSKLEALVP